MNKKVIIFSAFIVVGSLYLLQRLLLPKYVSNIVEGAMIAEYYQQEKSMM